MPVTLYHGPAGAKKRARLKSLAADLFSGGEEFIFITGNDALAARLKVELTALAPKRLIMGTKVSTFEELFLKLVKLSRHRAHVADKDFRLALLLVTTHEIFPAAVSNPGAMGRRLEQWLNFFDALKFCGVGPDQAKRLLASHVEDERLFTVFSAFQRRLAAFHDYDPSGLALAVLEDLREGRLNWLPGVKRVIIADAYPLHAGHREFLRLMKKCHPAVVFDIFYDEDFAQADDVLSSAYEELGELSDFSEHVEGDRGPCDITVYATPEEEAFRIAGETRALLDAGTPAHGVAIAIPGTYAFLFETALARHGVPYSARLSYKVQDHLPKNFSRTPSHDSVTSGLASLARRGNASAIRGLQAIAAWQRHESGMEFLNALLEDDLRRLPQELKQALADHLASRLVFIPARETHDVVLTEWNGAAAYAERHVFAAGLCSENVPIRDDDGVYAPSLKTKREFAELLRFPAYEYRVRLEKIRQLVQSAVSLRLSRSTADTTGRSVSRLPLDEPVWNEIRVTPVPRRDTAKPSRFFPRRESESFSVTGIETYLACPYQYYASKVLELGSPERDGLEPGGDARGHFVHDVLRKLVDVHREDYAAALKNEARLADFLETARVLARDLAAVFDGFSGFDPFVIEGETSRAERAIANLIRFEAEEFRKGSKVTLPAHAEWTLRDAAGGKFSLMTPVGRITLTGRVDRVDYSEEAGCFSIIDYKTGNPPSTTDLNEARSVQLPLYLMAVGESLYPRAKPSGAFYYRLKDRKIGGGAMKGSSDAKLTARTRFKPTGTEWENLKERVRAAVGTAASGIREGHFDASPANPATCGFCDYRRVCDRSPSDDDDGTES